MIDQLFRFIDPNIQLTIDDIPEKKAAMYAILLARYIVSVKPNTYNYRISDHKIYSDDKVLFHISHDGQLLLNNSPYLNIYLNNYTFDGRIITSSSCYNKLWDEYHLINLINSKYPENGNVYSTIGKRPTMEDSHIYIRRDNLKISLIADGHGGDNTSNFITDALPLRILQNFGSGIIGNFTRDDFIRKVILDTFLELDTIICKDFTDGSTTIMSFIVDNDFYFINLGDSRGILIDLDDKQIVLNTIDHKPNNDLEYKRIKDLGGFVYGGRVFGSLALSRALGDVSFKTKDGKYTGFNSFVSPEPEIYRHTLLNHKYIYVIACDGIWDVLSNDDVLNLVLDGKNSQEITDLALEKGSRDNISIMIVNV